MNRGNPASSPGAAPPGAGSPGSNATGGQPYPLPYGSGHYPTAYMSSAPYPDHGGPSGPAGPYSPMEYGGKYQFSGFQQPPYYNNQPSPNEESTGGPPPAPYYGGPGSMGSPPGGRDLNYFGYNNGFGGGSDSSGGGGGGGGPAFYPQQQQHQSENNNKTLGSDNLTPVSSGAPGSEVKSEVLEHGGSSADVKDIPELSDIPPELKYASTRGGPPPPGTGGNTPNPAGVAAELSDTKDSDNQSTRSHLEQSSPNPSPRSAGVKRSHSPSTSENNDNFDPQQQQFEALGPASAMNHGDEYMRQMSAMNNPAQNEGKKCGRQYILIKKGLLLFRCRS